MSKMTLSALQSAMASYVAAASQAASWSASSGNFIGLLDKIGKQVTIDGLFNDKLPELQGDELPLGKTVEEYFIDLTLPENYAGASSAGAGALVPAMPSVESVAYSYTLGRQYVKTTLPYDNYERACINASTAGAVGAKIIERLQNSVDMTKFQMKKQLIGNAIDKACAVTGCVASIAVPVDTVTGEAFIKQVKKDVEDASFAHMGNCLGGANALIGATPELVLYIKKGVMASLDVDTLAGAFNVDKLAIPARIKVLDDFGSITNSTAWAVLVDPRGIKLHDGYNATREDPNGQGDFVNIVRHFEETGFISKYTFIKVYKPA